MAHLDQRPGGHGHLPRVFCPVSVLVSPGMAGAQPNAPLFVDFSRLRLIHPHHLRPHPSHGSRDHLVAALSPFNFGQNLMRAGVRAHRDCLSEEGPSACQRNEPVPQRNAYQSRGPRRFRTASGGRQTFGKHQSRDQQSAGSRHELDVSHRNTSGLPADLQPSVTLAEEELKRVATIANHTLTYYRESAQPINVNLKQVAEDVLALERAHIASARVSVTSKFVGNDPIITAHPGEIRQILINLIENALDALSPGGKMYVSVRPRFKLSSVQPGYSLRVADSGHGISRAVMPNLFTPFFSTKGSSGTGLGLWIVRQITEKHGGDLRVRSREGVGTVVSIWLPVLANPGGGQTMQAKSQYRVLAGSVPLKDK